MTVPLRGDFSAREVRKLSTKTKDVSQSRRLLSIAAIYDGMNRTEAAKIGGMARQTLRDWVHHFNADGPEGLRDHWTSGPSCWLLPALAGSRRRSWASLQPLSRPVPILSATASCAGGRLTYGR